jgi:hypothetical protein
MTPDDASKIAQMVVDRLQGQCMCGLSQDARAEMPHLLGVIKDIGQGDYQRGVEVVRTG